jgi:integrase
MTSPSRILTQQRRAQATALRVWRPFRAALEHAYRSRRADVPSADAWRAVRTFRNVDQPRRRFLSVAEAKRLLNSMPPDFRNLARGALYTGLRLGELLELRVADVADGQVHVRHSKAGKGRSVPLSGEGAEFCDGVTAGKAGDELVFLQESGAEWKRIHASRYMKRACKAAKVDPPAVFHDLRRSYGSLLLNRGADAEVIQELLGHADLRMTRRAYAHLLQRTVAKVVKKKLPSFGLEPSKRQPKS